MNWPAAILSSIEYIHTILERILLSDSFPSEHLGTNILSNLQVVSDVHDGQFDIHEIVILVQCPVRCPVRWRGRNTHQRTGPQVVLKEERTLIASVYPQPGVRRQSITMPRVVSR